MADEPEETPQVSPADAAAAQLDAFNQSLQVTAPGFLSEDIEPTHFDRLSVERRVLAHITDEVNFTALGPRNTLAAVTYDVMTDRNTTHPAGGNPRMEIDGKSVAEIAQEVLTHIEALLEAGLIAVRDDGSYAVTEAGAHELSI